VTATLNAPTTPAELQEWIQGFETPEAFSNAWTDGSFQAAIDSYANAQNATMEDLRTQTAEQIQLAVHDLFQRNEVDPLNARNRLDLVNRARENQTRSLALRNPAAPGAGLDKVTDSAAQFFQSALNVLPGTKDNAELRHKIMAYSEKVPSEGGILVPEEWRSDIITRSLETSVVRPRAVVVPMPTGKLRYPAVDMTTEVGEVYGGMIFYWVDEGGTITPTDATFAAIALEANKLAGGALVPNELLKDAAALQTWLMSSLPKGLGHFEDVGLLKGNGVKKPLGALHADNPALITVSKEVGQPAASITWVNILAMFSRLLPESYGSAVWVISPDAIPEIFSMALPVGTGGSAVMIGEGGGAQGLPQSILGIPIVWSRKTPGTLGTKGDISLVDLSQYIVGDTQDMRIDTSEHVAFWTDKTGFRIIERLDGQPMMLSALTPENGGPTLSSFVQLETRA
jgi:HK97 family phage major capsid protein